MRGASLLFAILALGACHSEPPDAGAARAAVADRFAYPGSAEFQSVHSGAEDHQVCGKVRGRMVDGEMTDWRRFNWSPGAHNLWIGGLGAPLTGNDELDRSMARSNDAMLALGCDWS